MGKLLVIFAILSSSLISAQTKSALPTQEFSAHYYYGFILEHNPEIGHLITQKPSGILLSWNQKTYGKELWSRHYNYPDQGLSFTYQDMGNPHLGKTYGLYGHFNFYFLNRHLLLKVAQGFAYNTNPYNRETNYRNNAYGSHFMSATVLMGNFVEKNIFKGFGIQAGILLIHYSNGKFKAPNASTNSLSMNLGLNYLLDYERKPHYIPNKKTPYTEPVHYNFALRSGVNSSSVIGMGQFPFLTIAAYADKKLSHTSTFQAGTEIFFSKMLREMIEYESIAFPEYGLTGNESSTRIGIFGGYQLTINKFSFFVNLGYYLYYPYKYESRAYNRLGIQRELSRHLFASFSVHAHAASAENIAFTLGYRL